MSLIIIRDVPYNHKGYPLWIITREVAYNTQDRVRFITRHRWVLRDICMWLGLGWENSHRIVWDSSHGTDSYINVCIYECIYKYIHVCIHTCTYTYTSTPHSKKVGEMGIFLYVYVYTHVYTYVDIYRYEYIYAHIYVYTYTYTYTPCSEKTSEKGIF